MSSELEKTLTRAFEKALLKVGKGNLRRILSNACYDAINDRPKTAPARMGHMQGFYGQQGNYVASGLTRREVVKTASRFMNEGLYGLDLLAALKTRFEVRDIVASGKELRTILAEQGLQGIFYVDPSIYDDYGRCDEAARLHRTRLVKYIKQGSKCSSCVHQINKGICSKLQKSLVDEPPYVNKKAQQREILASGRSTETSYDSLMNNGATMMTEYQMQNPMVVDVKEMMPTKPVSVYFGTGKVKL